MCRGCLCNRLVGSESSVRRPRTHVRSRYRCCSADHPRGSQRSSKRATALVSNVIACLHSGSARCCRCGEPASDGSRIKPSLPQSLTHWPAGIVQTDERRPHVRRCQQPTSLWMGSADGRWPPFLNRHGTFGHIEEGRRARSTRASPHDDGGPAGRPAGRAVRHAPPSTIAQIERCVSKGMPTVPASAHATPRRPEASGAEAARRRRGEQGKARRGGRQVHVADAQPIM